MEAQDGPEKLSPAAPGSKGEPGVKGMIREGAEEVVALRAVELVDISCKRQKRGWVISLTIDKPEGVSVVDCRSVSQEMDGYLAARGILPEGYRLQVSSPGLDRELCSQRDFERARGKRVWVFTREKIEGKNEFRGTLAEVREEGIGISDRKGKVSGVPWELISKARLDPQL